MADNFKTDVLQLANASVYSGTAVPNFTAPEGSLYLRFVGGGGQIWQKTGAADADWNQISVLSLAQTYTAAQNVLAHDLGNIAGATPINALLSNTFEGVATAAAVIGVPTDLVNGGTYVFRLAQGGIGSFAITFNVTGFDFGDDGAPDTSGDAPGTLVAVTGVSDGTKIFCGWKKGFTVTP